MVAAAGTPSGAGAFRPLNQPEHLRVETRDGWPSAVWERGAQLAVSSVKDYWRVEDEWWRATPIVRTYFEVLLEDRRSVTLFFDGAGNAWYRQRYG